MKSTQNSSTEGRGSSCNWSGEVTKFDGGKPLLHPHCLTTLSLIAFRKQTSHFPLLLWPLLFSTCLQTLLLPDTVVASKSYVALLSPLHVPPDHSMLILAPMNWHLYTWHSHLGPQLLTCTYHRPASWDSSNPTHSKVTHSLFNIFKMDTYSKWTHLLALHTCSAFWTSLCWQRLPPCSHATQTRVGNQLNELPDTHWTTPATNLRTPPPPSFL
jgi:hypothetical protein